MNDPTSHDPRTMGHEERCRVQGLELVTGLSAVIRIGRAYSVANQVFRTQLASLVATVTPVLDESEVAVLVALESDLFLNGVRIPVSASNFRFHRTLVDAFRNRGISGVRIDQGVTVDDLGKFFVMFLDAQAPHGVALQNACLAAGIQHVQPAVHASTDPADEGGSGDEWGIDDEPRDPSESDPDAEPGSDAGGTGARRVRFVRGAALRYHAAALHGARSLLTTTSLHNGIEMRHAKRVVQPLVDGAFADEPVVVGLSSLRDHDEYAYAHSVNVSTVAVTIGHVLELDRRSLADLGVAALLHDVGKSVVADRIVHPLEAFTQDEREAAERHPIEGAKLLARSTALNGTTLLCMRVALEHHCSPDSGGFPELPPPYHASLISQIVSVADCYVSLQTRRGDLVEEITPYQALGMMLGPLRDRFEPALLWGLVHSVGFYPPGQMVELDDGTLAIVLAPNGQDLARPHLRPIVKPDGIRFAPGEAQDLLPLPPDRKVRRALRVDEMPRDEASEAA